MRKSRILYELRTAGNKKTADKIQLALINIKRRCYNPRSDSYKHYGGRGISLCKEWSKDSEAFYQWAISSGHAMNLSLDRIDNDGNYGPTNCRWADVKTQLRNRRSNRRIRGKTITEWAEITGLQVSTISKRLTKYRMSDELALDPLSHTKLRAIKHGTRSGYEVSKCRCQECTKCNTQRAANYRITRRL